MNKINLTKDMQVDPELEQDTNPVVGPASEQDVETAKAQATPQAPQQNSKDQVATRGDLIELHKRMVDMFKTLSTGLTTMTTEKANKDRAALSARIDEMERSLNTMEGMVRIEMVPQFRAVLNEALEERDIGSTSRMTSRLVTTALVVAGITAGVIWSAEIATIAASVVEYGRGFLTLN